MILFFSCRSAVIGFLFSIWQIVSTWAAKCWAAWHKASFISVLLRHNLSETNLSLLQRWRWRGGGGSTIHSRQLFSDQVDKLKYEGTSRHSASYMCIFFPIKLSCLIDLIDSLYEWMTCQSVSPPSTQTSTPAVVTCLHEAIIKIPTIMTTSLHLFSCSFFSLLITKRL